MNLRFDSFKLALVALFLGANRISSLYAEEFDSASWQTAEQIVIQKQVNKVQTGIFNPQNQMLSLPNEAESYSLRGDLSLKYENFRLQLRPRFNGAIAYYTGEDLPRERRPDLILTCSFEMR